MAELERKTPSTLQEFMDKADDFVNVEDTLIALTARSKGKEEHVSNGSQKRDRDWEQKARRDQHESRRDDNVRRHNGDYVHYSNVHNQYKAKEATQDDDNKRQTKKYCTYHKTNRHKTEDCHNLKWRIEIWEIVVSWSN